MKNKFSLIIIITVVILIGGSAVAHYYPYEEEMNIGVSLTAIQKLSGKIGPDRIRIKGQEIAKLSPVSRENVKFSGADYDIEIVSFKAIEKGVEVFARAWLPSGEQIGFGKDGTIDIERFIFINPPILVDDPDGDIIRESTRRTRTLREDPRQAILESLAHTIKVSQQKSDSSKIVADKIGSTVTTFFPEAGGAGTTSDAEAGRTGVTETWATIKAGAGNSLTISSVNIGIDFLARTTSEPNWRILKRPGFTFDTTGISGDTIDSATFSVFGDQKADPGTNAPKMNVYEFTPANLIIVQEDFTQFGSTALSDTDITFSAYSTVAYNDFDLNSTGLTEITAFSGGYTALGIREVVYDVGGSTPTWYSDLIDTLMFFDAADVSGTSSDPKLVVTHTGTAIIPHDQALIFLEG